MTQAATENLSEPGERPLSTLESDGRRRWMHPVLARGRYFWARLGVAVFLIGTFLSLPHLRINQKPAFQIDLDTRQLHLLGTTFFATETLLLGVFGVGLVLSVAVFTALFGRVWCGWACPQPVYLEFVFRPIETLFEGSASQRARREGKPLTAGLWARKIAKWAAFLLVASVLAHTFVSYFVGTDALFRMLKASPAQSPATFGAVWIVTTLMMVDFAFFREQTCILACPYGRLQSVLIDPSSLIVGYDASRGEPRGKIAGKKALPVAKQGDCVDCAACVRTCPTGIDIRQGLQMECIGCTQCIDACDAIMDKVKRPRGLIRYTSLEQLQGKKTKIIRPRVALYLAIVLVAVSGLGWLMTHRRSFEFDVTRRTGAPFYVQSDGMVVNRIRLQVNNRKDSETAYQVQLSSPQGAQLVFGKNPVMVPGRGVVSLDALVQVPAKEFHAGRASARLEVVSPDGSKQEQDFALLGPLGEGR